MQKFIKNATKTKEQQQQHWGNRNKWIWTFSAAWGEVLYWIHSSKKVKEKKIKEKGGGTRRKENWTNESFVGGGSLMTSLFGALWLLSSHSPPGPILWHAGLGWVPGWQSVPEQRLRPEIIPRPPLFYWWGGGGPRGWFLNWNRMSRWCPRLWKTPFHRPCWWRKIA